ncbi:leucine--tRNA ligase [candidate division LCP-89 bacterium B3_LCP]|uniref:Leucine--tRNA ligase n=1 Tax=candidate division LCP-89 bacterium B3_LCP TaxID=2012998 RepID=A0A532V0H0_UNCL8|nr:MAG: leucine--tRNA ligase [candidate division LCP-89 bacterium B3_LCP]
MSTEYPHTEIESKWKRIWKESGAHHTDLSSTDRKFYGLVMFSYPSAHKLHIGHWYNFAPADSYFRWKRMQGYNVFEPMGYDAFGLPAENYAVAQGVNPTITTAQSVAGIREQLEQIGAMYDWDREVNTSSPQYYKWTQWLFLTLHKMGLAYQKQAPVNWCPSCQTVLANEQVTAEGQCERCGTMLTKRDLKQWFFRITKYADKLLEGLKRLDWPRKTKIMQENWIGRSEGTTISFSIEGQDDPIDVFTTRADTLYGVTYLVFAPEHPLIQEITTEEQRAEVDAYIETVNKATEIERTATDRVKTGVFTGAYVIHPFTNERLQIWVADYVLLGYGTGVVMAVPAHDQRDFEFARKYELPLQIVIQPEGEILDPNMMAEAYETAGTMVNSGEFGGMPSEEGKNAVTQRLEESGKGCSSVNYRLRDWLISRQRYWGTPIPIIHCPKCGKVPVPEDQLPVLLPENVKEFAPKGKSPLAALPQFMEVKCPHCEGAAKRDPDTMDTFVCSSWYFLRYLSPERDDIAFDSDRVKAWLPVDQYIGGAEHSVMHLLYARFIAKALHDANLIHFDEPFTRLRHQGIITHKGEKMSKSSGNVVNPDNFVNEYGSDVFRMYMMFMGDYEQGGDWSDEGIVGIHRFVNRLWRLYQDHAIDSVSDESPELSEKLNYTLNYTIQQVTKNLEDLQFNTAISRMMELLNTLYEETTDGPFPGLTSVLDVFARVVAPFAPHLGEELWHMIQGEACPETTSVFDQPWPDFNPEALVKETITLVVQINGKLRDRIEVPADVDQDAALAKAKASEKVAPYIEGREIRKMVFVPKRLLNIVI